MDPFAVVQEALNKNISAIGITDHDTMDGLSTAKQAGKMYGIEVVPGIEFSADYDGKEVHILGYYCNRELNELKQTLQDLKRSRLERITRMIQKLKGLNLDISLADVQQITKGEILGRPHLALALCRKGYCKTTAEAFSKYIGSNAPAYVKRFKITTGEAVRLILKSGGIPVLAHPGLYNADEIISDLISIGLMGIEVFHPDHRLVDILRYKKMAREYNLLVTGGSDFHGTGIGSSPFLGYVTVDSQYLEEIKKYRRI
jgi:predicted metal-dependent phosphoesterase TrpH